MASMFEDYDLQRDDAIEKFEGMVGLAFTKKQILAAFHCTNEELEDWCKLHYNGCNYSYVAEAVRQQALFQFFGVCNQLGMRGNPSALGIINAAMQKLGQEQTVKIVFAGEVAEEDESDREDL